MRHFPRLSPTRVRSQLRSGDYLRSNTEITPEVYQQGSDDYSECSIDLLLTSSDSGFATDIFHPGKSQRWGLTTGHQSFDKKIIEFEINLISWIVPSSSRDAARRWMSSVTLAILMPASSHVIGVMSIPADCALHIRQTFRSFRTRLPHLIISQWFQESASFSSFRPKYINFSLKLNLSLMPWLLRCLPFAAVRTDQLVLWIINKYVSFVVVAVWWPSSPSSFQQCCNAFDTVIGVVIIIVCRQSSEFDDDEEDEWNDDSYNSVHIHFAFVVHFIV